MTTAPVLGYLTKPFILETDAIHDGLSAILSQEQDVKSRVLAFASRRLRPSEKNSSLYSSMKLEVLAMKWTITDKFRHYLLGGKFKVVTDNNPLTYFRSAKLGALEQNGPHSSHSSILTSSTDLERSTLLMPFPTCPSNPLMNPS